ncbi:MAG: KpsF/GutQ family sugar-phosphate isomerase [Pirellulaceae bacterium]|nr:KpsF/GutQ family sugar-phosphate isomerase [Pirellulaceae bacterium]
MNMQPNRFPRESVSETVQIVARSVICTEGRAVLRLADRIDDSFAEAVELLFRCRGSVIVTGMGKAGLVGQKIAATFASTGTRSHFLHPAEAIHGDLGRIHPDDVVVVLSHSGETEEVIRLLPSLAVLNVPVIAITGHAESQLGQQADVPVLMGELEEAGELKLAPSTSTTVMLTLGDALALTTSQLRGFQPEDFARFHPGGSLGRKLAMVEEFMRPIDQCRVASDSLSVRQVLVSLGRPGRRCGAVLLTDAAGVLTGIFTDSDLARILEQQQEQALDGPIRDVMTCSPRVVSAGMMLPNAIEILVERKISELPVVDDAGCPVGLIDITDVVGISSTLDTVDEVDEGDAEINEIAEADGSFPRILPLSNQQRNDA